MTDTLPATRDPGGRPPKTEDGPLTKLQLQFVELLASSGQTPAECAKAAGYAEASQEAYRLMQKPHIVKALRQRRVELVEGDLTGLALKTLRDTMTDTGAPRDARLKAAKIVLDLGQFNKDANKIKELKGKPIAEMTEDELRAMAAQLRADAREDARQEDTPPEDTKVINAVAEETTP